MRGFAGVAAAGTLLSLASPAAALDGSGEGGEAKRFAAVAAQVRTASPAPQNLALVSPNPVPFEDPTAPRLFGSLPVADNLALGVGLFSVVGTTEKEQIRRRLDPARAMVGTSDTKVAAVGMSFRF